MSCFSLEPFPSRLLLFPSPFFFYADGHHRDLHSFPTRRSSDLGPRSHGRHSRRHCPAPRRSTPQTRRDRKSTRLNSSHLVISYAVFCLKKKKKEPDGVRRATNQKRDEEVRRQEQQMAGRASGQD